METSLPLELLTMILDEFAGDLASLYSCILINRNWYGGAIQYLWSKPFTLLRANRPKNRSNAYNRRAGILLTTFIECFTDVKAIKEESSSTLIKDNKESL